MEGRGPPALLLHAPGHPGEGPALRLVHRPRTALLRRTLRRPRIPRPLRLPRRSAAEGQRPQPRQPAGGLQPAPRREDRHPLPGHHLRRLPHRRTALPGQVAAHRRRCRHAFHRRHRADPARRRLRPGARREHGRHLLQPVQVQPLRQESPRRTLRTGQVATARRLQGRARHPPAHRLERHPPPPLPHRGRPRPHRRLRAHRQQRLRRCHRPEQLPRRQRPGELSAGLGHLEIRLGAMERLGHAADGAQHRRGPRRRRAPADLRRARPAAAGRAALRLQRTPARPARPGRNPATTETADLAGRPLRPHRPATRLPGPRPVRSQLRLLPCTQGATGGIRRPPDAIPSGACTWCRPR